MTILLQGAMEEEIDVFIEYFKPEESKVFGGYEFFISNYKGNKIIISKTHMGIINASISTTIGINEFNPNLVINQGCAGGHIEDIRIGDLVIGESSVHINDYETKARGAGCGSNCLEWIPSKKSYKVSSTPHYVNIAKTIDFDGQKYMGVLGSGDLFSKEIDRIHFLHNTFGEICEDMESIASLEVCERFNIGRLALRIISNNEITGDLFDIEVCRRLQKFVILLVDKILDN